MATTRERRIIRRLESREARGLGDALVRLRGTEVDGRWEIGELYGAGAEGAVFLCRDIWDADRPVCVAKIALLSYHRPAAMSFDELHRKRRRLRDEADHLKKSASEYMPAFTGLYEFTNPLLDPDRGGAFAESEPMLVMERLPGFDLDVWLARVHAGKVPRALVRRNVDHVAVVVLRALWDLHERGFLYCDLRPGNIRIRGRSEHRVRLFDAGSLVRLGDTQGGFPHVPAYLPPGLFTRSDEEGMHVLVPSLEVQAVMAGRTLFEVATGRLPVPGREVDLSLLECETVSEPVAETIAGLCRGDFTDALQALKFLAKKSRRGKAATRTIDRSQIEGAMRRARSQAEANDAAEERTKSCPRDLATALAAARARMAATPEPPKPAPPPVPAAPAPEPPAQPDDEILPPSRPAQSWWQRLVAKLPRRTR